MRLTDGPQEIACTSVYLDDAEWSTLCALRCRTLKKRRHHVECEGFHLVIDELSDGSLLAEINGGDDVPVGAPAWLDVIRDVSLEEAWTGVSLAERMSPPGLDAGPHEVAQRTTSEPGDGTPDDRER